MLAMPLVIWYCAGKTGNNGSGGRSLFSDDAGLLDWSTGGGVAGAAETRETEQTAVSNLAAGRRVDIGSDGALLTQCRQASRKHLGRCGPVMIACQS